MLTVNPSILSEFTSQIGHHRIVPIKHIRLHISNYICHYICHYIRICWVAYIVLQLTAQAAQPKQQLVAQLPSLLPSIVFHEGHPAPQEASLNVWPLVQILCIFRC